MAYNINLSNEGSSEGHRQEVIRQANSAVDNIAKKEAVVEVQKRENAGQKIEAQRDMARYEADALKEETGAAQDSAEATVAQELATSGMPAAVQLVSTGAQMLSGSRSNPGHVDSKKLSKMTGGTVTSAGTFEDGMSAMLGSFVGEPESKGAELSARANALEGAAGNTAGVAVPPDAINVQEVLNIAPDLGQKQYYEQALSYANRPAARPKMPGLGNDSYKNGPKYKLTNKDDTTEETTSAWA